MESLNEKRRRIRAPYRVRARLEIAGTTEAGVAWTVQTRDANEWGMRIESPRLPPRVAVLVHLRAPEGAQLTVKGWIIHAHLISVDLWEAGVEFDQPQPLLSVSRIDLSRAD